MSRIFISHSSKDDFAANALADWLATKGWDDVFLDIDPQSGILPGELWARALYEAVHRCQAVVYLISSNWLASEWCDREFNLAVKLNKQLFGVVIDDTSIGGVAQKYRNAWQLLDLTEGTDHQIFRPQLKDGSEGHVTFSAARLDELREGLRKAGLDPEFFRWPPENDPHRAPYRGLSPLEAEDAGIFFGREAQLVDAMDELRGMRQMAVPRILTILGASGAGKSSFLRAGLLPRLERDDRAFRVLKIVRPQGAPLSGEFGLVNSLSAASPDIARATIESEVKAGGEEIANRIATISPVDGPTLILPIDQTEELFGGDAGPEAEPFLKLLRVLAENRALPLLILLTIRTDRYVQWQESPLLNGFDDRTFSLAPVPRGAYRIIIEEPVARYVEAGHELKLDPRLTAALLTELEEGESPDALPILAFTLEQLFKEFHASKELSLDNYKGLRGSISTAVTRALAAERRDPTNAPPTPEQLALLKNGMIPWLAGIDPLTKTARRKTALWSDIPEPSRSLIDRLVAARLLRRDRGESGEGIIEPAHEALLRQWTVLDKWLKDDIPALSALDGVKDAAQVWIANGRDAGFLVHAGSRLVAAEGLNQRKDLADNLIVAEREYLVACRKIEDGRRDKELRDAKQLATARRIGFVGASVAAIVALAFAALGFWQFFEASKQRSIAERQSVRVAVASAASLALDGQVETATLLLLDASKGLVASDMREPMEVAFSQVLGTTSGRSTIPIPEGATPFATTDGLLLFVKGTGDILRFDGKYMDVLVHGSPEAAPVTMVGDAASGLTFVRADLSIWRLQSGHAALEYVGRFDERPGGIGSNDRLLIYRDGTILWDHYDDEDQQWMQVFDPTTSTPVALPEAMILPQYYVTDAGARMVLDAGDDSNIAFQITTENSRPILVPRHIDASLVQHALFSACFLRGQSPEPAFDPELLKEVPPGPEPACISTPDGVLLSTFMSTSAGIDRTDILVMDDGPVDLAALGTFGSPQRDASWVGATGAKGSNTIMALVQGRDVFVGDAYGTGLDRRTEPEAPQFAKLLGDSRLALVEPLQQRIVVYELPTNTVEVSEEEADVEDEEDAKVELPPFEPLNPGTCVVEQQGSFVVRDYRQPDGRALSLTWRWGWSSRLTVDGKGVRLPDDGSCVQVSSDWRRMIMIGWEDGGQIHLYDLDKLVAAGSFEEASLLAPPGGYTSAFPIGTGQAILTSNGGYEVLEWTLNARGKWESELVYLASKPVEYAEPSADGQRLLLVEDTGARTLRGFLYSRGARSEWMELGTAYKWLELAFGARGDILVADGSLVQSVVEVPALEELVERARASLPQSCAPSTPDDYRSSPCWPAWL